MFLEFSTSPNEEEITSKRDHIINVSELERFEIISLNPLSPNFVLYIYFKSGNSNVKNFMTVY